MLDPAYQRVRVGNRRWRWREWLYEWLMDDGECLGVVLLVYSVLMKW